MRNKVGLMQQTYDDYLYGGGGGSTYQDQNYLTVAPDGGGGGGVEEPMPVMYPTDPVYEQQPVYSDPTPVYSDPIEQTVFTSTPATTTDTTPVYVDPGGDPIDYTPIDDSEYVPEDMLSTDQTITDTTTDTTPTTTNKFSDWIKANPLAAAAIALGLGYVLFGNKKSKKK